jgi:type IV secretion system protein VirB11
VPPVVPAPTISLRKPASRVYPLVDYLDAGKISPHRYEALREAVRERWNIVVVGGTGSGKTTLTNAILHAVAELTPTDRVLVIEDTEELQCSSRNSVGMKATRHISMHVLLRDSLRMRPDRIVVGEVRGSEALVVLKAWNTGHPGGVTTLHANSAVGGLDKLEKLAAEGTAGYVPRHEVAAAVQLVVYCERRSGNRRVAGMIKVNGLRRDGEYEWSEI